MRILHVIPSIGAAAGGPSSAVLALAGAQSSLGANVVIVCGANNKDAQFSVPAGVQVRSEALMTRRGALPSVGLALLLDAEISAADIVHIHSSWNGVASVAAWNCRFRRKRFVHSPHGMLAKGHVLNNRLKLIWWKLVDARGIGAAGGVHYLDETEVESCAFPASKPNATSVIVPNGVDVASIRQAATDRLCDPPRPLQSAGVANLLFLGRLHPIKGIDLQIDAIRELRQTGIDVHLHLVGPDDGDEYRLRAHAQRLDLSSYVHFHGPDYSASRYRWLRDADAVLLSSHSEGNSSAAAETFAAGGVLVSTDTCNTFQAAAAGATLMVPRSVDPFAAAIASVIQSESIADSLRLRAQTFAKRELSIEITARKLTRLYEQVLS